jgi:hypothetical protein
MVFQLQIVYISESSITNNNRIQSPLFCTGERISGLIVIYTDDTRDFSFDAAEIVFKGDWL